MNKREMLDAAFNMTVAQEKRIAELEDALRSIREHCAEQPSALAKAIVATCDNVLSQKGPHDGR